jgi:NAD-dependent deacetylase
MGSPPESEACEHIAKRIVRPWGLFQGRNLAPEAVSLPSVLDLVDIHAIARVLRRNPSVLFITGAGLSADSGLPTYRGIGGLYVDRDADEGVPIEEALSGGMFRRRPELTWKYIHQIARCSAGAGPNRGHAVIADMERRLKRVWVLTQNVDGLHRAAGSRNVIEIHGDVHDIVCPKCSWATRVQSYDGVEQVPTCPDCGAVVRPDVVLFGEMLPSDPVRTLQRELDRGFGLVFSVGTSSLFPYIAGPVWSAARAGVPTVEINPDRTDVSEVVRWHLRAGAAEALQAVADELGW